MSRKKSKQIKDKCERRVARKNLSASSGQALIEFILGLFIVIGFFGFYVKMAAVFAVGNYIHYATFMAARAYSSGADSPAQQQDNANAVLQKMLAGRWKTLIKPVEGSGAIPGSSVGAGPFFGKEDSWNEGVTYSYQAKIALYPWSKEKQSITMKLTSESWMRREESEDEVGAKIPRTVASMQKTTSASGISVEWDNGY